MKRLIKWHGMTWQVKAGLVAIIALALIQFALIPLSGWRNDTIHRITDLKKSIAKKKALIGEQREYNTLLTQAKASYDTATRFYYRDISDPKDLQLKLQKEMERLASSCNVKINTAEWLNPSEGDIVAAPIALTCEAPVNDIIGFIRAIETYHMFLSVDRLQISARPATNAIRAEIAISAYGLPGGS